VRKKCLSEVIGTFALVFVGTGAIVIGDASGTVSHLGVALAFGLVVMTMIYALGDISGAHLNPAVTLGFFAARRIEARQVAPYVASQFAGAVLASTLVFLTLPQHPNLGATRPSGSLVQSFVLEVVLTWLLMFVILNVSTGAKEKGITAGIAIGSVIAFEALFAGAVSGASMNPARSLGPAVVSARLDVLWLYFAAPIMGALLAVPTCRCVHEDPCCARRTT